MPLFTKSKFKRRAGQAGVGSQLALGGISNQSLARISAGGPRAENEDASVQDSLNIIETKTTQINELTCELKLKESALEDCLSTVNILQLNIASQGYELQRKTQEVDQLKNELRRQGRLLQSHIQDAKQLIKKARMGLEKEQHEQLVNAFEYYERRTTLLNDQYRSHAKELRDQLSKEQRESARLEVEVELSKRRPEAQEQTRLEHELAKAQAERDATESRARREAKTLGEQLDQKGQRIHELDEQVQMQTETIDQTRLALNRIKNELTQEKSKARQAIEESATKSQQLEFVQQQCARLQEQLRDRTVITRKPKSLFRTGKEMEEEVESVILIPQISTTKTEKDLTERVECGQQ